MRVVPAAALALGLVLPLLAADNFTPTCPLPFKDIAARRPFDDQCGGDGQGDAAKVLQNDAKNNFCRTGTPALVTFLTLKKLQAQVEDPAVLGPHYSVPTTRTKLENIGYTTTEGGIIGEGSVVQIAAWIYWSKYSDTSSGEDVNCNLPKYPNNDVHIALMADATDQDECHTATAEISPHYRPTIWNEKTLNAIDRPVRITGQLFFDASHKPCENGKRPNPKRSSSWEIHPVYNVEVCKTKSLLTCKADDDSKWESLEDYLNPATNTVKEDSTGQ